MLEVTQTLVVRPRHPKDDAFILELARSAFARYASAPARTVARLVRDPAARTYVAVAGARTLGIAIVSVTRVRPWGPYDDPALAHLDAIAVASDVQRHGIGRALLTRVEDHAAERGKRVCTETEWTMACEGPDRKPFPYGYTRDATKCHGDKPWDRPDKKKFIERDPHELERLWQGVKSGSQPDCISDYGVHDMPANADELAASETYGKGPKSDFDNVTTGGPWYKGVRNQCRPKIYSHDESFAYYYLSWRCCAEPDGKPTDPRAPKQIKRGLDWDKVVYRAEHSWKLPLNPKVPGDEGYNAAGTDRKIVPRKDE